MTPKPTSPTVAGRVDRYFQGPGMIQPPAASEWADHANYGPAAPGMAFPRLESHPDLPPWYAVRVQSKFERVASTVLQDRGFEDFLPLYQASHQWSDRVKRLELPLFPGYLFCRIDLAKGLLPVVTAPGVLGLVSAGRHPLEIPEAEIETVRLVIQSGLPTIPWPGLQAGSPVLVERGPLAGVEGVVLSADKACKLIVSVTMLQRAVAVEIQRDWVRPISGEPCLADAVPLGWRYSGGRESVAGARRYQ